MSAENVSSVLGFNAAVANFIDTVNVCIFAEMEVNLNHFTSSSCLHVANILHLFTA